jgi:hypothetical protein
MVVFRADCVSGHRAIVMAIFYREYRRLSNRDLGAANEI